MQASGISGASRILLAVALMGFPLHFAWEWLQCGPYFVHQATPPNLTSMLVATAGDVALTSLAYGFLAARFGASWPLGAWRPVIWVSVLGIALALSLAIELYALQTGRWSYTAAAPRLPGTQISLLPIAQMLILLPLSMRLGAFAVRRLQTVGKAPVRQR